MDTLVTRYFLMKDSLSYDSEDGEVYADPLSLNYSGFIPSDVVASTILSESDITNLNRTLMNIYGSADLIDVVLTLNEVGHSNLLRPGDSLYLPSQADMLKTLGGT